MHLSVKYRNRNPVPWTRYDEITQRLGNCRRMLVFAWLALRYDSMMFATVLLNCSRQQGDLFIANAVANWDGEEAEHK